MNWRPKRVARPWSSILLILVAACVVSLVAPSAAHAAGELVWSRYYSNAADIHVNDAVLDNAGRFIVAGSQDNTPHATDPESDALLVKYRPWATREWVRTYNHTANDNDECVAVAVDSQNAVLSAGRVWRTTGDPSDMLMTRHRADGSLNWWARISPAADGGDRFNDVAVGTTDGAVFTGSAYQGAPRFVDIYTQRRTPSGAWTFVNNYNSPFSHWDYGVAVATDGPQDSYVLGRYQMDLSIDWGLVLLKYEDSVRVWERRYAGPTGYKQLPVTTGVDMHGNVYVLSGTATLTGAYKAWVVESYTPAGTLRWRKKLWASGVPRDMFVTKPGWVVVTGTAPWGGTAVRFDADGTRRWARRVSGIWPVSIGMHPSRGYAYVAGDARGSGGVFDVMVHRLPQYTTAWTRRYHRAGFICRTTKVCVNTAGVYVAGRTAAPGATSLGQVLAFKRRH